jgi:hypothetical protein
MIGTLFISTIVITTEWNQRNQHGHVCDEGQGRASLLVFLSSVTRNRGSMTAELIIASQLACSKELLSSDPIARTTSHFRNPIGYEANQFTKIGPAK